MNRTVFKAGLVWQNIGEVAVILGDFPVSVLYSAHLRLSPPPFSHTGPSV